MDGSGFCGRRLCSRGNSRIRGRCVCGRGATFGMSGMSGLHRGRTGQNKWTAVRVGGVATTINRQPVRSRHVKGSKMISFTVYGKPQQMGSKTAFVRGGKAILTDTNRERIQTWHSSIAAAAAAAMNGQPIMHGPVRVAVEFWFSRPSSHFRTGKNANLLSRSSPEFHAQTPDVDKLLRCLLDGMSGVVYSDDRQVFETFASRKWTISQSKADVIIDSPRHKRERRGGNH